MGPVLEEQPVLFEQRRQILAAVGLVAGEQDLMVRPLDRLDAVDLDEAERLDQLVQSLPAKLPVRRARQPLPLEEDLSRLAVVDQNRHAGRLADVRRLFNGKPPAVTMRAEGAPS